MENAGKARKLVRLLFNKGEAKLGKNYPNLDSIVSATLLDRAVELPAEKRSSGDAANLPVGMALVRIYRNDRIAQNFTLRIDGAPRAVLKPGAVFETMLPAGEHEFSSKVKFKMFATGLPDKAFAGRDKVVEEFRPGTVHHFRSVPAGGDNRTLRMYRVADDFGADECANLTPARLLEKD